MDQATAPNAAQGVQNTEPQPGTAEYNAAMAAKADGLSIQNISADGTQSTNVNQPNNQPSRPEWLPEKFQSPEDMAKAYTELEKKLSGGQQTQAPTQSQETKPTETTQEQTNDQLTKIDISKFDAEFTANGALSDASYAELEKLGFGRDVVDAYIEGQQARSDRYVQSGYEAAGGQERFGQMVEWAKANLPKSEIAAFNAAVNSMNVDQMKLAVTGLAAKFTAANGVQPTGLMMGSANPIQATGSFQSRAQVVEAMSDPRYQTDPAYRRSVEQKLMNSNVF